MNVVRLSRVLAVAFLAFAGSLIPRTAFVQTDADWDWMREDFGPALDTLMPIREDIGTHVTYRSYHDLHSDVIEYSFILGHDPNVDGLGLQGYLSAHVRMADSVSIYDQMMKMHRDNPQEEASTIRKRVKIKEWNLTERTCPKIRSQFREFRSLRFRPPHFDEIVLDPLVHQFTIQTGAGDMDLTLVDSRDPLVAWALRTRRVLEKCAPEVITR
jgi:hypothetical protein